MWQPQQLRARHHEIIRMHFLGRSGVEIAGSLGITPQTVYCILASPLAKYELDRLKNEADQSITDTPKRAALLNEMNKAAEEAVTLRRRLMNDETTNVRTRDSISRHFMDRIIFDKPVEDEDRGSYKDLLRLMKSVEDKVLRQAPVTVIEMDTKPAVTEEFEHNITTAA